MSAALRIFYRRVYVTGLETIPSTGPAILIANHTSSLMDAAILGILLKRPLHAFARGDIFAKRLAARMLGALNMIPVHQHSARGNLHSNNDSFIRAQELLTSELILYFPEGRSHIERRLDSFRKGVFRLAFQAAVLTDFHREIPLIPVGINYSHPTAYQSDIMLNIGTPLLISNYKDEYATNPNGALLRLTRDCHNAVKKQVLIVEREENYQLAENCLAVKRNDYLFFTTGWLQATRKRFEEERRITSSINALSAADTSTLRHALDRYFHLLRKHRLSDKAISPAFRPSPPTLVALLLAGMPVFAAGYLLNALPILIARRIADKKVYRVDYYSWVFVATAAIMHLIWLILLFVTYELVTWRYAILVCLLAVASGAFASSYLKWWKHFLLTLRKSRLVRKGTGILQKLVAERQHVLELIDAHTNKMPVTAVAGTR